MRLNFIVLMLSFSVVQHFILMFFNVMIMLALSMLGAIT